MNSLLLGEHDIVLTTYENLRKNQVVYKRIHWHRIVLDECQEVKIATNQVLAHNIY